MLRAACVTTLAILVTVSAGCSFSVAPLSPAGSDAASFDAPPGADASIGVDAPLAIDAAVTDARADASPQADAAPPDGAVDALAPPDGAVDAPAPPDGAVDAPAPPDAAPPPDAPPAVDAGVLRYLVTVSSGDPVAGQTVTVNAQLATLAGTPVAEGGRVVGWTRTGGGMLGSESSVTGNDGLASVVFTTSGIAGAVHSVTAGDATGAAGTSAPFTTRAGPPSTSTSTVKANPMSLPADGASTSVITVDLLDEHGNDIAVGGAKVAISTSRGSLSAVNDEHDGRYTATLTAGTEPGTAIVTAELGGTLLDDDALVSLTPVVPVPVAYRVSAAADPVTVGGEVAISAQLVDQDGNPLAEAGRMVAWTRTSTGATQGSLTPAMSSTNGAGVAVTTLHVTTSAGATHTVTATDDAGLTGTSDPITTQAGPPDDMMVAAGDHQAWMAGQALPVDPEVRVVDQFGNRLAGVSVSFTPLDGGGVTGSPATTDGDGVATVGSFTLPPTSGQLRLRASAAGLEQIFTAEAFAVVNCTGTTDPARLTCMPVPGAGATVTVSDPAYAGDTGHFTFQAAVQNRDDRILGEVMAPGIRVAFENGPTVTGGTGSATVTPDGTAAFTAPAQPYYQYLGALEKNEGSSAKTWTLVMPDTVESFSFKLIVAGKRSF